MKMHDTVCTIAHLPLPHNPCKFHILSTELAQLLVIVV